MNEPSRFLIFFAILVIAIMCLSGWAITHHWEAMNLLHELHLLHA
jgi:hypothetical protein